MKSIHCNPTPLRKQFIQFLTLQGKAQRTIQCSVGFIHDLAKFHRTSPDQLAPEHLQRWFYHLITERQRCASSKLEFHGNLAGLAAPSAFARWLAGLASQSDSLKGPRA